MSKYSIFCSIECNREYHSVCVGYPGDGDEDYCENCGVPLKPTPKLEKLLTEPTTFDKENQDG